MQKVKDFFKEFFKTRTVGYYIMIATLVLALVENIIYVSFYKGAELSRYYSPAAFAVPFIAIIACLALSMFKQTYEWAPIVFFGLEVCAFCLFVNGTYMYLTSALFGGFNMSALLSLSPGLWTCAVFYIAILILGVVVTFLKGRKESPYRIAACSENEGEE